MQDGDAVAQIIRQTVAIEYDYRGMHFAKVPFNIYFKCLKFNYKFGTMFYIIHCSGLSFGFRQSNCHLRNIGITKLVRKKAEKVDGLYVSNFIFRA